MRKRFQYSGLSLATVSALLLAACSAGGGEEQSSSASSGSDGESISVVFQKSGQGWSNQEELMKRARDQFLELHPGAKVSFEPVAAQETDYFTRLQLMHGSPKTAPSVIYQDTFQLRSDVAAGYLAPMEDCVAGWDEWDQFEGAAHDAGTADDGLLYGVSMGTDTRGLFFNKDVFENAGLPLDWQPKNWDEILDALRSIKASDPSVIPMALSTTKAQGEATSMQTFEMLLYGTGDTLYDEEVSKWVIGSTGFRDSLKFLETGAQEDLFPPVEMMLDTNLGTAIDSKFRNGEVGLWLNGSFKLQGWLAGDNTWPDWEEHVGLAMMPTQKGQDPGFNSMSGGWLLSIGSQANYELACDFIKEALDKDNSLFWDTSASEIAVRKDVASDKEYLDFNPSLEFFTSLVPYTHFRPATPEYPSVSDQIQIASEAVVTGQASPDQAAAAYDAAVERAVGSDNVVVMGD